MHLHASTHMLLHVVKLYYFSIECFPFSRKKKLYFTALFLFNILCVSALTITYMFLEKMFDCTLIEQGFDFGHS